MAEGADLGDLVRRTVQANARFYKGWMDLTFEYFRGLSEIFGAAPSGRAAPVQEADAGAGAVVLEGEAGSVVRGAFLVTNDMDKAVKCAFSGSDFRDPRGTAVPAKPAFDPAALELAPGEQRVVQVSIAVDDTLTPGVGYAGEILVRGMEGLSVPVVLRRQHQVDVPVDAEEREEAEGTGGSGAPERPRATRRKGAAGTAGAGRKRSRKSSSS